MVTQDNNSSLGLAKWDEQRKHTQMPIIGVWCTVTINKQLKQGWRMNVSSACLTHDHHSIKAALRREKNRRPGLERKSSKECKELLKVFYNIHEIHLLNKSFEINIFI